MANMDIALQAHTFNPVSALSQVDALQAQDMANDFTRQTQGDWVDVTRAVAQSQLAAAAASQEGSKLATTQTRQMRLANAMAQPQTADEWDDAMHQAVDDGIPEAEQYIGRYNPERQGEWVNALAAQSPGSALAAASGVAATPTDNPMDGAPGAADSASWTQRFASMDPKTLEATTARVTAMRQAIQAVEASPDPAAEWKRQAIAMGHPEQANDPNWRQKLAQLKATVVPAYNALGAMQLQQSLGIPKVQPPARIERGSGGQVVSIEGDPSHPTARTLVDSHYKPTAFADRQQAYLAAHPDDTQGALDYAAGKPAAGVKSMTPAAIEKYAESQSAKELNDARLNGDSVGDPAQWQQSRKAEIISNLSKANAQGAPAAGGGAATPAAPGFTGAQRNYEKQFPPNPKAPDGDRTKPFFVKTFAEVQAIKQKHPGAFVVGPSGQLKGPL